jgi:hypothetical protein
MELIKINKRQREALLNIVNGYGERVGAGMSRTLREMDLIIDTDRPTSLGRYQVRWYRQDCADHWSISSNAFGQYVKRGTAPAPDGHESAGATSMRAWWYPETVTSYKRPTRAASGPPRADFDVQHAIRMYRAGTPIRQIAPVVGVHPSTVAARLEELGEKERTSASRHTRTSPLPERASA